MTALFNIFICFKGRYQKMTALFEHFHLFQKHSKVHKGRAHHTKASWYFAASQAVIISNYQSVVTFSTRDF